METTEDTEKDGTGALKATRGDVTEDVGAEKKGNEQLGREGTTQHSNSHSTPATPTPAKNTPVTETPNRKITRQERTPEPDDHRKKRRGEGTEEGQNVGAA